MDALKTIYRLGENCNYTAQNLEGLLSRHSSPRRVRPLGLATSSLSNEVHIKVAVSVSEHSDRQEYKEDLCWH